MKPCSDCKKCYPDEELILAELGYDMFYLCANCVEDKVEIINIIT